MVSGLLRGEFEEGVPPSSARSAAEIADTGVVLREPRAGYSTHGYDFDDATGTIIGCALEVHRTLGPGFGEIVYQRALAMELRVAGPVLQRDCGRHRTSEVLESFLAPRQVTTKSHFIPFGSTGGDFGSLLGFKLGLPFVPFVLSILRVPKPFGGCVELYPI
jgi:hypothetical protein